MGARSTDQPVSYSRIRAGIVRPGILRVLIVFMGLTPGPGPGPITGAGVPLFPGVFRIKITGLCKMITLHMLPPGRVR
jgi:hypothetical protein